MNIDNIKNTDRNGEVFLRCSNTSRMYPENYFDCVDLIRPLLENPNFLENSQGFYINIGKGGTVRLTCIANNLDETNKIVQNFAAKESAIMVIPGDDKFGSQEFRKKESSGGCTEDYLHKRRFLTAYTQIGLDLLKNYGRQCSRCLVAEWRLTYFPQGEPCRTLFEPIFRKHCDFFTNSGKLQSYSVEQFWEDLDNNKEEWVHYLVNMLLPGDLPIEIRSLVINLNKKGQFPKTLKESFLHNIRLDMPDNWRQNC